MKKLLTVVCMLISITSVFGKSYEECFEKAQKFEEEKKYAYALANYYDAMNITEENTEEYKTTRKKYNNIKQMIENGKPGLDEYDPFELYDKWVELLQEFEHYWTENCPFLFKFSKPERQSLNSENRTADYTIYVYAKESDKFYEIRKIVSNGLRKVASENAWNNENFEYWPHYSIYNTIKEKQNEYIIDNIPLIYTPFHAKIYNSYRYFKPTFKLFAPAAELHYYKIVGNQKTTSEDWRVLPYDLKFDIVDNDGNIIFQGKRKLFSGGYSSYAQYHDFTVSAAQLKIIDSGNYKIVPTGLYLQYGKISDQIVITEDSRDWIKNLTDFEIALDNVEFIVKY